MNLSFLPERIVCLSSETTEIVFRLGAGDRVAGVPGYATRPPEAALKPKVGGFTSIEAEKVLEQNPDLVLGFSDLQKDIARELIAAGVNVLVLNQRSLHETLTSILTIGRAIGREERAQKLTQEMAASIRDIQLKGKALARRPKIYFEEWDDPMIAGIGWIGEMIEIAGGEDVLSEMRGKKSAGERIVDGDVVVDRNPDVILAAWCGKRVDVESIRSRPGWNQINAVRKNQIFAVEDELFLSPGPALIEGLQELSRIVERAV